MRAQQWWGLWGSGLLLTHVPCAPWYYSHLILHVSFSSFDELLMDLPSLWVGGSVRIWLTTGSSGHVLTLCLIFRCSISTEACSRGSGCFSRECSAHCSWHDLLQYIAGLHWESPHGPYHKLYTASLPLLVPPKPTKVYWIVWPKHGPSAEPIPSPESNTDLLTPWFWFSETCVGFLT